MGWNSIIGIDLTDFFLKASYSTDIKLESFNCLQIVSINKAKTITMISVFLLAS